MSYQRSHHTISEGAGDDVSAAVVGEHAGGNPLFIEAVSRAMRDAEADGMGLTHFDILTVEAAIQSRLDQLADGHKDVSKYASVYGQTFFENP